MNYKKIIPLILCAVIWISFCSCGKTNASDIKEVNIFDYTSDLTTPLLDSKGFFLEIQEDDGTCEKLGIGSKGTKYNSATGKERMARAEEWGYSLTHLNGITDGMGREIKSTFATPPTDRKDAVDKINQYLDEQYKSLSQSKVYYSMNGHYPWHHYAGENGFDVLGSEIGESINNYQYHIAMNRGAAKQFNTPWFIDFSMWHGGTVLDYNGVWDEGSEIGGHSLSLFERSMVMSYMSGTSSFVAEGGGKIAVYNDKTITPYGETCKKVNDFTKSCSDIGNTYVPFAIVLDYYHGTYMGQAEDKKAFATFDYNDGDNMTDSLLNMIYDKGIVIDNDETGTMVNNGGDLYDFFLQDVNAETIAEYPAVILSGDIKLSDDEVQKYLDYAKAGGTLILNSAYLNQFENFEYDGKSQETSYGKGSIIVYADDYSVKNLKPILEKLTEKYVPFIISEDVEYIVNTQDDKILLTLINNDGVTKKVGKNEKIKKSASKDIDIQWNGTQSIKSVREIYNNKDLETTDNITTVHLGAGDIAILEYTIVS